MHKIDATRPQSPLSKYVSSHQASSIYCLKESSSLAVISGKTKGDTEIAKSQRGTAVEKQQHR